MTWTPAQFHTAKLQADAFINGLMQKNAPGGMAGIVAGDNLVWQRHWGLASLDGQIPNMPGTRHCIGSASKMFTAALAWKLIQQGRLDIRVPVSTYIPDVPVLEQITLHHLLTMTSGLPDHAALMGAAGGLPHHERNVEDHLALLRKLPALLFTPGTACHDTDMNYLLLAEIIASITGQTYHQALQDNILTSCNISEFIAMTDNDTIRPQMAIPTLQTDNGWQRGGVPHPCIGSGDMALTLSDCATWINTLRAGQIDGTDITPLWQEIKINDATPAQYGMGMMIRRYRGLRLIGYAAHGPGYQAHLFYAPDIDVGFILMQNHTENDLHTSFQSLIDIFTADALPLPSLAEQSRQNLEKAAIADTAAQKLNGSYINIETLQTIELEWRSPFLQVGFENAPEAFICNSHGYFSSVWDHPAHIKPVTDKTTGQIALDAIIDGKRQRFVRVETLGAIKHAWMDYVGEYMLEALEAKLTLTARAGTLYVRTGGLINSSWAMPMIPLAYDLFQATQAMPGHATRLTLQFDREPNSKLIRQLILTNDGLPLLTFRKLRSF